MKAKFLAITAGLLGFAALAGAADVAISLPGFSLAVGRTAPVILAPAPIVAEPAPTVVMAPFEPMVIIDPEPVPPPPPPGGFRPGRHHGPPPPPPGGFRPGRHHGPPPPPRGGHGGPGRGPHR